LPHKQQRTSPAEGWTAIPQTTRPTKALTDLTDIVMPTARHEMPQEYQGMKMTDPSDMAIWEGPLPVPRAITPQTPPVPITNITPEMFWELPKMNPRTPQNDTTPDEPFEAYKPDLGHQVEMTPEETTSDDQVEIAEQQGHPVEMTYPTPSHQVEMTYPSYTSWYKPSSDPNDHQVEMVKPEPEDHQVEMVPQKKPVPSQQVETTQTKTPAASPPQTTSGGGGWTSPRPCTMKQKLSNIPKMKGSTMKDLDKYNKDFKKFMEKLIR